MYYWRESMAADEDGVCSCIPPVQVRRFPFLPFEVHTDPLPPSDAHMVRSSILTLPCSTNSIVPQIYHHSFQLEHNPNWARMALQRFGDPDGPMTPEEEVSGTEISW